MRCCSLPEPVYRNAKKCAILVTGLPATPVTEKVLLVLFLKKENALASAGQEANKKRGPFVWAQDDGREATSAGRRGGGRRYVGERMNVR